MSQQVLLDLPSIDWPKLRDTILASSIYALTEVNNWSIRHPYVAAGALICISISPDILLTPLRLTGRTTLYICLLPLRLILWPFKLLGRFILYIFGFRRYGVAKGTSQSINYRCLMTLNANMTDSLASQYQSHIYGGYVPQDSTFARFQSYGAAEYYDDLEALRSANVDDDENTNLEVGLILAVGVSWLSAIGAVFVLGRTWGWWN
ncbi:hypothetical protein DFJ58DRAFT_731038 [Suillus subalutaceus]|uniref:uncharacterized protein n=1 Tax=Suillus subalutaceus TaxID=48586 RepID=UPI001B88117B|nr:uncharacterized protein DFJ58DRAFT_731038 [Suillus subalutaceus]KAG1844958.1 hypothetical protein DFJ58DRAFT_731038 [Suillus subalutaceus]